MRRGWLLAALLAQGCSGGGEDPAAVAAGGLLATIAVGPVVPR